MSDHLPSTSDPNDSSRQPEVRLELTRAGVEQVLSLYSQEQGSKRAEAGYSFRLADLQQAFELRRRMILIGVASGIAVALLVLLTSSPMYSVSAQVVLERNDSVRGSGAETTSTTNSAFIATQAEIMASRSVVEAAVASLPRPGHLDADDDAGADALDAVVASPITGTQVISLGYLGPDAGYGVQLLEAIVASYRLAIGELEQKSLSEKLAAKQAELDLLEREALALEANLEARRGEHGVLGSGTDAAETQAETLRDYAQQIAAARSQRIGLESRLATGGKQLAILDPATRELQEELRQAEAELARVKITLMPMHPAVETAQQNVDILRKQLAASSGATPAAMRRDLQATIALERQLELAYAKEKERMADIEAYRRDESTLVAELEQVRALAETRRSELVDQRLLTRLAEAGEVGVSARLIEPPIPPEQATWPRPGLLLIAGTMLGLSGGFAAALFSLHREREALRTSWIPSPGQASTEVKIR